MDDYFHQTLISGIGKFQPIYIYIKPLSTYFGIPDILVFEKYIGYPLSPKTKEYRNYYKSGAIPEIWNSNPIQYNLYSTNLISDKVAMIRHRQVHLVSITLAKTSLPASPVTSYIDKTRGGYRRRIGSDIGVFSSVQFSVPKRRQARASVELGP